jgi:hypothetical protein
MKQSLEELIVTANKVQTHFGVSSYEMNHYEDGSYIDFKVNRIVDLPALMEVAGELEVKCFCDNGWLIVRLFERDCY